MEDPSPMDSSSPATLSPATPGVEFKEAPQPPARPSLDVSTRPRGISLPRRSFRKSTVSLHDKVQGDATVTKSRSSAEDVRTASDELREAMFARAKAIQTTQHSLPDLTEKFSYAAGFSVIATFVSTLVAALVWRLVMLTGRAPNALWLGFLAFVSVLIFLQVKIFAWLRQKTESTYKSRVWDMTSRFIQDTRSAAPTSEAAHWLNGILDSIWPFINPDLFRNLADIVEAIIQSNAPPFISAVSIEEIGQGSRALRLVGVRQLDKHLDNDDPTAAEIFESIVDTAPSRKDTTLSAKSTRSQGSVTRELKDRLKMLRERTSVHVEAAFEYDVAMQIAESPYEEVRPVNMLLAIYLPGGIKLPVWVELRKIIGSVRARVQLKPDPPFVTKATVSLMGKPEIQFSCKPIHRKNLNVMSMPLVSSLVQQALDTAMNAYIAPNSLTLDLGAILTGDESIDDVPALGIIVMKIHRVYDIHSFPVDKDFESFVMIRFKKLDEPMYITRTVEHCPEPRWEEEAFYEVGPDEVNASESIQIQLFRSKHMKREECLGTFDMTLAELLSLPECSGRTARRSDVLSYPDAAEGDTRHAGTIEWSVGYYSKTSIDTEQLERQKIFPPMKTKAEFEKFVERQVRHKFRETTETSKEEFEREKTVATRDVELQIMNNDVPLDKYPSGILMIRIPQLLFLTTSKYSRMSKDSDEVYMEEDYDGSQPYSYASIYVNSKRILRTRVKPKDPNPAFNSECSCFIRDWRNTEIVVIVRDKRISRSDTLLGVVRVPLGKFFAQRGASFAQLHFPLEGGEGSGLVKMGVLFRATEMHLPRQELGWDHGNVRVDLPVIDTDITLHSLRYCDIVVRAGLAREKLHPVSNAIIKNGKQIAWRAKDDAESAVWLPVKSRYVTLLVLEFHTHPAKRAIGSEKICAYAYLRLAELCDGEKLLTKLSVYPCAVRDLSDSDIWTLEKGNPTRLGEVAIQVTFERGVNDRHESIMKHDRDLSDLLEAQCALGPASAPACKTPPRDQ